VYIGRRGEVAKKEPSKKKEKGNVSPTVMNNVMFFGGWVRYCGL
jgi:hypothetical protein